MVRRIDDWSQLVTWRRGKRETRSRLRFLYIPGQCLFQSLLNAVRGREREHPARLLDRCAGEPNITRAEVVVLR